MIKVKKVSIGIFGGSFDPPHKAHLKLSLISIKKLRLNKIFWVVTKKNPFKKKSFFSLKDRVLRCKKITKKINEIKVLSLDKKLKSVNIINTILYLKKKNKKSIIFLIIGSDNLINFHKWKKWKKIVELTQLVVFSRKGYDKKGKKSFINKYLSKNKIIFVKNRKIDISSTQLRKNLQNK
tara:strand:+ start:123 stop:662 length:540 start_codon:yes stop_codon:yes gene_type:complete